MWFRTTRQARLTPASRPASNTRNRFRPQVQALERTRQDSQDGR